MAVLQKDVVQCAGTVVVEVRSAMGYAPEAGGIELFDALGVAKADVECAGNRIGWRRMAACTIVALEDQSATFNCRGVARAAKIIEWRRQLESFQVGGNCRYIFPRQRIFALHRIFDGVVDLALEALDLAVPGERQRVFHTEER